MNNNKLITLTNKMIIPSIGFGTCKHTLEETIDDIVLDAIDCGYRYFDTASFYATERDIGRALKRSGLKREKYFIASKLWYEELGYENIKLLDCPIVEGSIVASIAAKNGNNLDEIVQEVLNTSLNKR